MQNSTGALILVCQSSQLDDFAWFAGRLDASLKDQTGSPVTVVNISTEAELVAALRQSPAKHPVSEIHVFAEFLDESLVIREEADEVLQLDRLQPVTRQDNRSYPDNVSCRIWFWSDGEPPGFGLLKDLSRIFGHHFFLLPVSQLKTRLSAAEHSRRKSRSGPKLRTNATKVDRRKGASLLSLGKVAGYILLCGLLASMLAGDPVEFELLEDHDHSITHTDNTETFDDDDGELVRYTWVHKRIKWDYEWFIARAWLANAERELQSAAAQSMSFFNFWPTVYRRILAQNQNRLDSVAASLKRDAEALGYDDHELATLTLSFVQHITYRIPSNELELLTPPVSLAVRYGDCDTKSVLYVLLMQKLGFKTSIFLSMAYQHAMAGISVPAVGTYMQHGGTRYYFAETTYPGHRIGSLPQGMSNMGNWQLVPLPQKN